MTPYFKTALQFLAALAVILGVAALAGAAPLAVLGIFGLVAIPTLILAWRDRNKTLY